MVSVNFGNTHHFVRSGEWEAARRYLADRVDALERVGADVVLCVSNTMHRVVAPICCATPRPRRAAHAFYPKSPRNRPTSLSISPRWSTMTSG